MFSKNVAKILLNVKTVSLNLDQPFRFASGLKSPIYCDNRLLLSCPKEREAIVNAFLDVIKTNSLEAPVIAGTATAGIAWAAWIADRLKKSMVYVRVARKEHGRSSQIEGGIPAGQSVLLVEDLVSTGKSSLEAAAVLKENGCDIRACLCIFSYQLQAARYAFAAAKIPLFPLTHITDVLELASEKGDITNEQKHVVLEWRRNPKEWGKKYS